MERRMPKALTFNQVEQILAVTDALGISREAVVIPLRAEHPGRLSVRKDGKLEIVVESDGDFANWLSRLAPGLRSLMNLPAAG
jgi:hypothetical protein